MSRRSPTTLRRPAERRQYKHPDHVRLRRKLKKQGDRFREREGLAVYGVTVNVEMNIRLLQSLGRLSQNPTRSEIKTAMSKLWNDVLLKRTDWRAYFRE